VAKAIAYAVQIASGLAAAHAAGVVHSDLKPENILITKDGRVKIADFGLANLTDPESAGALVADYASPEQVRGEPETAASDIFSLGAILHEMLSGARPFLRPTLTATTQAILNSEPPHELPSGVTPALGRIVTHCLAKAPEDRFASAADLAFAIQSFANLTIPHDKIRRPYKKRLTGIFLAWITGVGLGVGGGAMIARSFRDRATILRHRLPRMGRAWGSHRIAMAFRACGR
jgi:serine/threonine protein kinase